MNITEFLQLAPGNEIQQGAHVYRVIHNHAGVVVAQRTIRLSTGDDWSFVTPKIGDFPGPTPKRPSASLMRQQILDANGLAIESKDGTKYRIRGRVFDTLEYAWDTLPKVGMPLSQMREDLRKIGWIMSDKSSRVVWTSPGNDFVPTKSFDGTLAAWDYVFGDEA